MLARRVRDSHCCEALPLPPAPRGLAGTISGRPRQRRPRPSSRNRPRGFQTLSPVGGGRLGVAVVGFSLTAGWALTGRAYRAGSPSRASLHRLPASAGRRLWFPSAAGASAAAPGRPRPLPLAPPPPLAPSSLTPRTPPRSRAAVALWEVTRCVKRKWRASRAGPDRWGGFGQDGWIHRSVRGARRAWGWRGKAGRWARAGEAPSQEPEGSPVSGRGASCLRRERGGGVCWQGGKGKLQGRRARLCARHDPSRL